ncbi:hypothetical protein POM88_041721 [Heracleum sosnowskyi]|nr:hypothetical protein POM88_041721 [Heracleum sosnowskyi]
MCTRLFFVSLPVSYLFVFEYLLSSNLLNRHSNCAGSRTQCPHIVKQETSKIRKKIRRKIHLCVSCPLSRYRGAPCIVEVYQPWFLNLSPIFRIQITRCDLLLKNCFVSEGDVLGSWAGRKRFFCTQLPR